MLITAEHGNDRRYPRVVKVWVGCYFERGANDMSQQVKKAVYRLTPLVVLVISIAAPRKWGL